MQRERDVALEALRAAASICTAVQTSMVSTETIEKRDKSPVTVADFASQAMVCRQLQQAFPGDPVVGEESSAVLRERDGQPVLERVVEHVRGFAPDATPDQVLGWIDRGGATPGGRFWTLDPIDGTKGFLRREQYAVALGLIDNGTVVLGALACPLLPVDPHRPDGARGLLAVAIRGEGAWSTALDDPSGVLVPMQTDRSTDPRDARLVESVESGHANQDAHRQIAERLGIRTASLRMDSQAKYAAVARGDATIYLRLPSPATPDYREKIWDHAAGMCVVEAAGGRVTDALGAPLDFNHGRKLVANRGVIATSGPYHDEVLAACAEVAPAA
jgi:3'(2'), 5'-bisphosphate nucleotidase